MPCRYSTNTFLQKICIHLVLIVDFSPERGIGSDDRDIPAGPCQILGDIPRPDAAAGIERREVIRKEEQFRFISSPLFATFGLLFGRMRRAHALRNPDGIPLRPENDVQPSPHTEVHLLAPLNHVFPFTENFIHV